jgi:hypothetical protein
MAGRTNLFTWLVYSTTQQKGPLVRHCVLPSEAGMSAGMRLIRSLFVSKKRQEDMRVRTLKPGLQSSPQVMGWEMRGESAFANLAREIAILPACPQ